MINSVLVVEPARCVGVTCRLARALGPSHRVVDHRRRSEIRQNCILFARRSSKRGRSTITTRWEIACLGHRSLNSGEAHEDVGRVREVIEAIRLRRRGKTRDYPTVSRIALSLSVSLFVRTGNS